MESVLGGLPSVGSSLLSMLFLGKSRVVFFPQNFNLSEIICSQFWFSLLKHVLIL